MTPLNTDWRNTNKDLHKHSMVAWFNAIVIIDVIKDPFKSGNFHNF